MATLTVQSIVAAGLNPSYAAAAGGGDEFANDGSSFLHVVNGGGGAINVTLATTQTVDGLAVADQVVNVPAGEDRMIGPLRRGLFNDAGGLVQVTYDGVTSVTVGVFAL